MRNILVSLPLLIFTLLVSVGLVGQIAKTDGTVIAPVGIPSLTSCGTSPTLSAESTDLVGTINVGSGVVTSCTLTFSTTRAATPPCFVGTNISTITLGYVPSTTNLVMTASLTIGSGKLYYFCPGN